LPAKANGETKAGEELIEIGRGEGRKEGIEEGEIKGEIKGVIKTYQELLNNALLPKNMVNQFNHKIVELQNKLQKMTETYAAA